VDSQKILEEARRCLADAAPSCACACPLGLDVRGIMEKLRKGLFSAAWRTYSQAAVFPGILSHVCEAPCGEACVLDGASSGGAVRAVDIRGAERFLYFREGAKGEAAYRILDKHKNIAIIGGGLTGLSCAMKLSGRGYHVTLFEQSERLGGRLLSLPDVELPAGILASEIERVYATEFICVRSSERVTGIDAGEEGGLFVRTDRGRGAKQHPEVSSVSTISEEILFDAALAATGATGGFGECGGTCRMPGTAGVFTDANGGHRPYAESVRRGIAYSYLIETYLKTGRMEELPPPPEPCRFTMDVAEIEESVNAGVSAIDDTRAGKKNLWSDADAVSEANRCLLCSCRSCARDCDLLKYFGKDPKRALTEAAGALGHSVTGGNRASLRQILACTGCGACGDACPVDIDLGRVYLELRRSLHKSGRLPVARYDYWLNDLEFSRTEAAFTLLPQRNDTPAYVYFPGCQIGASEPAYVTESWAYVKGVLGDDVALAVTCCGAPAAWAAEDEQHEKILNDIRSLHEALGKPVFLLACPTCGAMFAEYMPQIETKMLWDWMTEHGDDCAKAGANTRMSESESGRTDMACSTMSVFDPCVSLRAREGVTVRTLLARAGITVEELQREKNSPRCCGFGGLIQGGAPEVYAEVIRNNAKTGALPLVCYCSNCRDSLAAEGREAYHLFEIVFGARRDSPAPPSLSTRRKNRLELKETLNNNISVDARKSEEAYSGVLIPDDVLDSMRRELVIESDAAAIALDAFSSGECILDEKTGEYTAHRRIGNVTYWVRFCRVAAQKQKPSAGATHAGSFRNESSSEAPRLILLGVYTHRMIIVEEGGANG